MLVDLKDGHIILCQITSKNISDDMAIALDVSDIDNGTLNMAGKLDEIVVKVVDMFRSCI